MLAGALDVLYRQCKQQRLTCQDTTNCGIEGIESAVHRSGVSLATWNMSAASMLDMNFGYRMQQRL